MKAREQPLVAVGVAAILAVFLAHVIYLNCVVEDAYITFRFSRNLAAGHGVVWNAGQPPVEGYTNFLWLLIIAGAMRLGLDVPLFSQIAGTLFGLVTMGLSYAAGRQLGWPRTVALFPSLMLAVSGPFAAWSGSGLETVPFAALVFVGLYAFGRYWQTDRSSWMAAMGLALTAATLMRPEGAIVFALLGALSFVLAVGEMRARFPHLALGFASWAIPSTLYFVWRYRYFGYPLPNTFYAKTGGGLNQIERGVLTTAQFAWQFVTPLVPAALVGAWEAGAAAPAAPTDRRRWMRRHAFLIGAAVIALVYSAYIVAVGNDYMAMHRFFVPIVPLLYMLAAVPFAVLSGRLTAGAVRGPVVAALVAVAAAGTFVHSLPIERHFDAESTQQHGNYRGIERARWSVQRLLLIGRFFATYRLSSAESLATNGIGAIGYSTDIDILDFNGLVDVHVAHSPIGAGASRLTGHQKSDYPYTLGLKPTYIMFGRDLTRRPGDFQQSVPPGVWPLVEEDYVVRSVLLKDEANGQSGYFSFLERRDHARPR
jgi:arabinofuranosyltransferase